jgi:hypothetical protein
LILYDEKYQRLVLRQFGIGIEDQCLFDELEQCAQAIYGRVAHTVRKFACWFGPFDEFIYFDADIVVFQDQKDIFDLLSEYDIVYCGSGRSLGIKHVFTERALERNLFLKQEIDDLFNTGFFASKKGVLDMIIISILTEAAAVSDIFDRPDDQPLINYVTLKAIAKRQPESCSQPLLTRGQEY